VNGYTRGYLKAVDDIYVNDAYHSLSIEGYRVSPELIERVRTGARMGRFLMNLMLASGGYPWTVIPLERRNGYMAALESVSVRQDVRPFAALVGSLVEASLRGQSAPPVPAGA
jgi:hypothetical protein